MKHILIRICAALTCVTLLLSGIAVYSEDAPGTQIEITEQATAEPVVDITPEPTPEPTAEVTPEVTVEATIEPTVEATIKATAEPTVEPAIEPTIEPAARPTLEAEASPLPETADEAGIALLALDPTEAVVQEWMEDLAAKHYSDDYQKAFWLYRRMVSNIRPNNSSSAKETAEAALVDERAGSLGFARAYKLLLDAADISCRIAVEKGDENEAWNVVKLEGHWTHVDVFMDARNDSVGSHFGLTDLAMARDHSWVKSSIPSCTATSVNYFVHEQDYIPCANSDKLYDILTEAIRTRATQLRIYWCGKEGAVDSQTASDFLEIMAPMSVLSISEKSHTCILSIRYADVRPSLSPTQTPTQRPSATPTATPTASASATPTVTPAPAVTPTATPVPIPLPDEILAPVEKLELGVGDEYLADGWVLLPVGSDAGVSFASSNSAVAAVDADGRITGKKVGSASIALTTDNGCRAVISVSVKKAPTKISSFVAERALLGAGETVATSYKFNSGAGGSVSYKSSKKSVATIDENGVITAHAPGEARITVTSYNGKSKSGVITVVEEPKYILLSSKTLLLGVNDSHSLSCELSEGSVGAISFTSSDEGVVSVSSSGRLTAKKVGTAVITAQVYNGLSASCSVTVASSPDGVHLSAERTTLGVGESIPLVVQLYPEDTSADMIFASSNSKVLSVDADGVVTARKTGSATIGVKTRNGETATLKFSVKKAPTGIALSAERTSLSVGESVHLKATLSSGSAGAYRLASSDQSRLTIDENGLATAISGGEVQVYAETYNGKRQSLTIRIVAEPETLTLARESVSIGVSDSWQLEYALNDGAEAIVSFASSNEGVATVSEGGLITAMAEGSAVITASTVSGLSASCNVSVVTAPTGVELSSPRSSAGVGESMQLSARILPEGTVGSLKYASSDAKVIAVNESGMILARKVGSATITVSTCNGRQAQISLSVKAAPGSVSLSADRTSLGVGESMQLNVSLPSGTAGGYSFASSDESRLTIDESGLATALAAGEVSVSVETYNGVKRSGAITILPAPLLLFLEHKQVSIAEGDSWALAYSFNEGAGGSVRFASSDETVVTVDENGMIHAVGAGSASVSVESYNGLAASCNVSVVMDPESVSLASPRGELGVGESMQLNAATLPDGAMGTLEYASSNPKIISVDESGMVTAKKTGTATITVKTYNGKTAELSLAVRRAPASVSIATERATIGVGESVQLSATLPENTAGGYSFISADESIVTVDESGLATAHATGRVKVSVKTYNGKTKSGTLTVVEAPSSISVTPESVLLPVGESLTLVAETNRGSAGALSFVSDHPEIIAVDSATGTLTAIAQGSASITVAAYNGVSAVIAARACPLPSYITLPYDTLEIGVDDSIQLQPETDPGSAALFEYASRNPKIASVDENGVVTAQKTGSTQIAIRATGDVMLILPVKVLSAPRAVKFDPEEIVLGLNESTQLHAIFPANSTGSVRFESLNTKVATVDESGVITAHKIGTAQLRVETYNGKTGTATLTVVKAPKSISMDSATLGVGQTLVLNPTLLPEGSHSAVSYEIISGDAVELDNEKGSVTALREGTATLKASTYVDGVSATFSLTVKPAPRAIDFDADEYELNIDSTLQLSPVLTPGDSMTALSYSIDRAGFFTIDEGGLVTPIMRGSSDVTITTHNGLSATITIRVVDPYFPQSLAFVDTPPAYLEVDDSYTPIIEVYPETAVADLVWKVSDPDIASVEQKTGKIIAESHGTVTIEAVSQRNPALMLSYKVVVLSPERCLTMPARRTETNRISTTLSSIRQVRSSAYRELEALYTRGDIGKSEYNTRKSIITRAFDMYLFPWMTQKKELYWKEANSENGAKDFKPGVVYYGLPYTQTKRTYDVSRAVKEGFFVDTGKNYYLLNNDKFADRQYAGNDCSAFASMSVWGTGKSHSSDSTRTIATTNVYKTLSDWKALRPGDLLNKSNSHVVIFLYYANSAKTQMVIIEQGGGEAGTNTVSTSIRQTSYYQSRGYAIKRLASLK